MKSKKRFPALMTLIAKFTGEPGRIHRPEPRHRCGECATCVRSIERAQAKRARKAAR